MKQTERQEQAHRVDVLLRRDGNTHRNLHLPAQAVIAWLIGLASLFGFDSLRGQNIVELTTTQFTANPVRLTDTEVSEFLFRAPDFRSVATSAPPVQRIAHKLDSHVAQFLDGAPWMPFHHTLGISGHEVYFDHPDELFLALSLAVPALDSATKTRLKAFLSAHLASNPPYLEEGCDRRTGRPRESYMVPDELRLHSRGQARSTFGVYAFWAYCYYTADSAAARERWPAVLRRMTPLLENNYKFDVSKKDAGAGAAQKLNGDLAGLIGLVRLARLSTNSSVETKARARARELFELRVNLERVNPHLLEKSTFATKSLHNARLSRYCDLVPEVGEALARSAADSGARNVQAFREERNGWWLAFGDRFIGGENYTNPRHFPHSLFGAAALFEKLPGDQLLGFIDVPWCKGDLYFIEDCALALWVAAGRPWKSL